MRTTVAIDDDVLAAVKELAATQHTSIGEVLSSLARSALRPPESLRQTRNGIPLLSVGPDAVRVTSDLVKQLQQELP